MAFVFLSILLSRLTCFCYLYTEDKYLSSQSIVLLIMGVCGSGKTLIGQMLAEKLDLAFVDADQYHPQSNKSKLSGGLPLTDEDRLPWLNSLSEIINKWLADGKNGVLACSALKESYREILISDPSRIHVLYLQGTHELFSQRLAIRKHEFMNSNLLASQLATLEEPQNAIYLDASLSPKELVEIASLKINEQINASGTKNGAVNFQQESP